MFWAARSFISDLVIRGMVKQSQLQPELDPFSSKETAPPVLLSKRVVSLTVDVEKLSADEHPKIMMMDHRHGNSESPKAEEQKLLKNRVEYAALALRPLILSLVVHSLAHTLASVSAHEVVDELLTVESQFPFST